MRFETDRFVIRKLRLDDFEDFYDMQSSENVMRYIKAPLDHDESKAELEKFIGYYSDDKRYFHLWAIVSKTNEDFVGICGVYHNDKGENEIAYRLREKYWGNGIGGEVAKGLISYCFDDLGMDRIVASADEGNIGSVKILDREMNFVERYYSGKRECFVRVYFLNRKGL